MLSTLDLRHRRWGFIPQSDIAVYTPALASITIQQDGTTFRTINNNLDNFGNPQEVTEEGGPHSRTWTISYLNLTSPWLIGLPTAKSLQGIAGNETWTYDNIGRLEEHRYYGRLNRYTYCGSGPLRSIVDEWTMETLFSCSSYKRGIARDITEGNNEPELLRIIREVDDFGRVRLEDRNGRVTSYTYDDIGRMTSLTTPQANDSNISFSWSTSGRTRTTNRGAYTAVTNFDALGRTTQTTAHGIKVTSQYDGLGRTIFNSVPQGEAEGTPIGTAFTYDPLGRITNINPPGPSQSTIQFNNGFTKTITDARGNSTQVSHRSFGSPDNAVVTNIAEPGGIVTAIQYNDMDMMTQVTQGGASHTYTYNNNLDLITLTQPEIGTRRFTVDRVNRVTTLSYDQSPSSLITHQLNARGQTISKTYQDGTPTATYTYNSFKEMTQANSAGTQWQYTYDANGRNTGETLTQSGHPAYQVLYNWNNLDHLASVIYPDSNQVTYSTDPNGRVNHISRNSTTIASNIAYFPDGKLIAMTLGNGLRLSFNENSAKLPSGIHLTGGGDIERYGIQYGYDNANNLTSIAHQGDLASNHPNLTFGYDGTNRLTTMNNQMAYQYNAKGDITAKNDYDRLTSTPVTKAYNYNTNGQLTSISNSAYQFTYDGRGNVTNNGTDQFVFDGANRLVGVPSQNLTYVYDANDKLVRTVSTATNSTTYSLYNHKGSLLYETKPYGSSAYIYLNDHVISRADECTPGDIDGDTLDNCLEVRVGMNPLVAEDPSLDSDGDGLTNLQEITFGSSLHAVDTEGDGFTDLFEFDNGMNPLLDDRDFDNDGLVNYREAEIGTDPNNPDTDGDGYTDGEEVELGLDPFRDDGDNDKDGIRNADEIDLGTDPNNPDTDGDGHLDGDEVGLGSDPLDSSSVPDYSWIIPVMEMVK